MDPAPSAEPRATPTAPHRPRLRHAIAVAAGVAMVPALYAVANAATDRGGGSTSTRVGCELVGR